MLQRVIAPRSYSPTDSLAARLPPAKASEQRARGQRDEKRRENGQDRPDDGRDAQQAQIARSDQVMPHEPTHPTNSYATPTPTTDGARVYCSFGSFGLYALTFTGELVWRVDLGDESRVLAPDPRTHEL
jgi:hypothetical protein